MSAASHGRQPGACEPARRGGHVASTGAGGALQLSAEHGGQQGEPAPCGSRCGRASRRPGRRSRHERRWGPAAHAQSSGGELPVGSRAGYGQRGLGRAARRELPRPRGRPDPGRAKREPQRMLRAAGHGCAPAGEQRRRGHNPGRRRRERGGGLTAGGRAGVRAA